jgi:hypothetical protein
MSIARQTAVLERLVEAVEADPRIRALELKGSIARGDADELSDLDTRLWIADDDYDAMLADLPALARSVGKTRDILFETPGSPFLFVQFEDGVQLELSTSRASQAKGLVAARVVLLDRDGLLAQPYEPEPAWDRTLWLGWAWMHLYDVDKYLRRGSLWEALITLEESRSLLLRHHAAALGVPDPEFGLKSILDAGGTLPARLDETVAALGAADIRRAACVCAELLTEYGERPFGDYVRARLESG